MPDKPDNIKQGAEELAGLLKNKDVEGVANRLKEDFNHMSPAGFRDLVKQAHDINAADLKADKSLPELKFTELSMDNATVVNKVDITTPGKIFGNMWRNTENVIDSGGGMLGHDVSTLASRSGQINDIIAEMQGKRPQVPIERQ